MLPSQEMLLDLDAIYASHLYGMPLAHLQILAGVAQAQNTVIGIRGVHPLSRSLIEHEILPTKPFGYYAKTAQFGPCTGTVPVDPKHSRSKNEIERSEHQKDIRDALGKPNCEAIQALVSKERLFELAEYFGDLFKLVNIPEAYPEPFSICWRDDIPGSPSHMNIARFDAASNKFLLWDVEEIDGKLVEKPTMVLGYRVKDDLLQLGTDYDLAFVGISWRSIDFQKTDKSPVSTQGSLQRIERELKLSPEDPLGGNWSPRIKAIVQTLNEAFTQDNLKREDRPLVHHNADLNNPFSKSLESHIPCLVALPVPMDLSSMSEFVFGPDKQRRLKSVSMLLLTDVKQYVQLHALIKSTGYYLPMHYRHRRLSGTLQHYSTAAASAIAAMKQQMEGMESSIDRRRSLDVRGSFSTSTTMDSFISDGNHSSEGGRSAEASPSPSGFDSPALRDDSPSQETSLDVEPALAVGFFSLAAHQPAPDAQATETPTVVRPAPGKPTPSQG